MGMLGVILRRARRSFAGSLALRFAVVVAMAILAGATAGVLPAVIGQAVGSIAGSGAGAARPPSGFARWIAVLMPDDSAWAIVLVTLVATVITVGVSVLSSKLGSALAGDVTAAVRIEMLGAVLGASARDVGEAGQAITAAATPPGMEPPGKAPPGKAPPGKAPGGMPAARGTEVVKLAVSRESAMVSDFAVSVLSGLPQSLATLLILGYELVVSDAWFALAGGLGLFVLSRLFADRASRRVGARRRAMQNADAAVFGDLQEKLNATEDLRLWGARAEATAEFARVARECAAARARFAAALAVSGQIKSVFMAMSPLLIVVALQLAGRDFPTGEVAKLLLLVPLLMGRLEALDGLRSGLLEREPLLKATVRLLGLPAAPPRADDAVELQPEEVRGSLSLNEVCFTPPGAPRKVIDSVSLEIPAGSVVGICGPSGSGKSSLLRLLLRLDDPDEGSILLDDTALDRVEPAQLPQLFGVVRQTSQPLQRAVRDNLGLGLDPKPSDEAMAGALSRVALDELARSEPGGRTLDTEYRAHPPNFSGGEVRRLLLARMLLSPCRVFVLDEPEAGLPSATAEQILKTTRAQAGGRTLVVVTHAPHLLGSDFNVVLDQGRVVAVGPHDELVEECEIYRELLAESLRGGDDETGTGTGTEA
jgi:ABC-type multidrug transport system fused ATPase/permease subunit